MGGYDVIFPETVTADQITRATSKIAPSRVIDGKWKVVW